MTSSISPFTRHVTRRAAGTTWPLLPNHRNDCLLSKSINTREEKEKAAVKSGNS